MIADAGGWTAASASVRGASHERSGKPNQDAVRVLSVDGPTPGVVAAVCDGHGGDRYVRSDVGSRLAAEEACAVGRSAIESLGSSAAVGSIEAYLRSEVSTSIVERWRTRVMQDVDQRPFTDDERARAGDPLDGAPLISYGCTLVLALCAPQWIGFLQIGDGDVTVVQGNSADAPVPGDDRLVGGETTSLCLPTAVTDARVAAMGEPLPDLVVLTSDGYANSFASPTWRTDVGLDLRSHVGRLGIDGVEAQLASWLTDSAVAAGDDVSMALIHRQRAPGVGATATTSSIAATSATSTTAAPTQLSTRRWAAVASVGVAAIIGVGVGWLLADRGGGETTNDAMVLPATSSAVATTPPMTTASEPELSPSRSTSTTLDTTTPTTTATTVERPVLPAVLDDQAQVLLLVGEENRDDISSGRGRIGVVLAFDPESSAAPNARSFAWVVVGDRIADLPSRWEQGAGSLEFDGESKGPAVAVARSGDYVWAVGPDRRSLTAYDAQSGARLETTPILDFDASSSTAQAAPPGQVGSVPGTTGSPSSTPSETTES